MPCVMLKLKSGSLSGSCHEIESSRQARVGNDGKLTREARFHKVGHHPMQNEVRIFVSDQK